MSLQASLTPQVQTLVTGLQMGESPRWHDGRLWFADWIAHEIMAVGLDGACEASLGCHHFPFASIGCLMVDYSSFRAVKDCSRIGNRMVILSSLCRLSIYSRVAHKGENNDKQGTSR